MRDPSKAWTQHDVDLAVSARRTGASNKEIGLLINRTETAVNNWFRRHGAAHGVPHCIKVQQTTWGPAEIEIVVREWNQGAPASVIAVMLGGGRTRNAVIGWVHRHGHKHGIDRPAVTAAQKRDRVRSAPRPPGERKPTVARIKAQSQVDLPLPVPILVKPQKRLRLRGPKTMMALRGDDCRYIVEGDREHALFCGEPVASTRRLNEIHQMPYCAEHCYISYRDFVETS